MTQAEAFDILKTGANVFLTGEPGSGKTYLVNQFVGWLKERGIQPAITASTGIAATHINGHTIHSWCGIGVKNELNKFDLARIVGNERVTRRVRSAHTLIIDEISMLSSRTFGLAEIACRAIRGGTAPFGGLQVVLVGDFFQLPPVITQEEDNNWESTLQILPEKQAVFAFESPAWNALNLTVCYLSEQHRQEDPEFLGILSAIRSGTVSAEHRALLTKRLVSQAADGSTQFFSRNAEVNRVNSTQLARLPGEEQTFEMQSHGAKHLVERLVSSCLSPEKLVLKIGARVMFTKNDTLQHRFVNGTLGTVVDFTEENGYPIVQTNSGGTVFTELAEWRVEEGDKVLARIIQLPLRLAWAITVHKSQGMSLDAAHMDLTDAFEHGQGYVAISRVRTLAGLTLVGWNDRALQVHPEIATKDMEFRNASRIAEDNLAGFPAGELTERQNTFVRVSGGRVPSKIEPVERAVKPKAYSLEAIREKHKNAGRPWSKALDEELLRLKQGGETIWTMAIVLGRRPNAIRMRLEKLADKQEK